MNLKTEEKISMLSALTIMKGNSKMIIVVYSVLKKIKKIDVLKWEKVIHRKLRKTC